MKSIRTAVIVLVAFSIMYLLVRMENQAFFRIISLSIGGLFLFSLLVRRNINFRPYFTSSYNLFTAKIRRQDEFDIAKDILFDKLVEVLSDAGFTVRYTDKGKGVLFATSRISMFSWGENIYVDMTEKDNKTVVDFCSASFFGAVSWGRNEKNYKDLLETFENSLTI